MTAMNPPNWYRIGGYVAFISLYAYWFSLDGKKNTICASSSADTPLACLLSSKGTVSCLPAVSHVPFKNVHSVLLGYVGARAIRAEL